MKRFVILPLLLAAAWALTIRSGEALSQELGPIENFGVPGKLFARITRGDGEDDYYLQNKQSYSSGDSSGFEGKIQTTLFYTGGAFEKKYESYFVACTRVDAATTVTISPEGLQTDGSIVEVGSRSHPAREKDKPAFNLFWAVCKDSYKHFR